MNSQIAQLGQSFSDALHKRQPQLRRDRYTGAVGQVWVFGVDALQKQVILVMVKDQVQVANLEQVRMWVLDKKAEGVL